MASYDFFVKYYDEIVRGNGYSLKDEVDMIDDFIKKFYSKKEDISILELACGTGIVASELIKKGYNLTGLDLSEKMLEKAKINIGEQNCILGDMTKFSLEKKYDIVLCNYNSICHLTNFSLWKSLFENAYNHLEDDGLLIFDINTVFEFESITRDYAQFFNLKDDTVCLEMFKKDFPESKTGEYFYEWFIKIFSKNDNGSYDLKIETIEENSFSIKMIKQALKTCGFTMLALEDFHNGEVDEESERVYFIAKKTI